MPLILILIFFPLSFPSLDKMLINSHLWNLCDSCCLFNFDYKPMGQASFLSSVVPRTPKAGKLMRLCIVTVVMLCQDGLLMLFTQKWMVQVVLLCFLNWKIFSFALAWLSSDFIRNTKLDTKLKWCLNVFLIMLVILIQNQFHLPLKGCLNHLSISFHSRIAKCPPHYSQRKGQKQDWYKPQMVWLKKGVMIKGTQVTAVFCPEIPSAETF